MARDNLKRQHQDILRDVQTLRWQMATGVEASSCRTILFTLAGKVRVHMAMEESAFQRLAKHESAEIRRIASDCGHENEVLKQSFFPYVDRWVRPGVIENSNDGFCEESHYMLAVLADRIDHEENELFARLDNVQGEVTDRP